jgi:sugar phosphate isomerase/epimerase
LEFAICNEIWRDTGIEKIFTKAAALGFDGVEIAPFTLAESVADISADRRREIVRAAADAGVAIVGLHWLFLSPKGLHLTTPDQAVWQKSVDYLKALTDFCGDLGASVMIFGSPKQRDIETGNDHAAGIQRAADAFRAAGQVAADRNVHLAFEALAPKETNFINTAKEATELASRADHPNVGIMLDTKAMSAMPDGIIGTTEKYGAAALHFHVNDPSGKGPGMNGTDFKPILAALAKTGYDRWVSAEPFDYQPDPDTVARVAIETMRAAAP